MSSLRARRWPPSGAATGAFMWHLAGMVGGLAAAAYGFFLVVPALPAISVVGIALVVCGLAAAGFFGYRVQG